MPAPEPPAPESAREPTDRLTPRERALSLQRKAGELQLQGRLSEAASCLELAVQLDPASDAAFDAWLLLARLRMANPLLATPAVNAFQAAARIRPAAAEPWTGLCEVYHRKGLDIQAADCFSQARERDPALPLPPWLPPQAPEAGPRDGSALSDSLFQRFRSILGDTEKG